MSIKTYRLLWVDYYKLIDLYAVPKDWELDKIDIKTCQVYYDGVLQENISYRKEWWTLRFQKR
jgi:hypothetical protein